MVFNRYIYWVGLLCLLLLPTSAAAQDDAINYLDAIEIVSIDDTQFPEISVQFRATEGAYWPLYGLQSSDFIFYENDNPIDNFSIVESEVRRPSYTIIVLDLGAPSNLYEFDTSILRQNLNSFVDQSFQSGWDGIALFSTNPSGANQTEELIYTYNASEYRAVVNQLTFEPTGFSTSLNTVEYAYDVLVNAFDARETNLSIVYIGAGFDDGQEHTESIYTRVIEMSPRFNAAGITFISLETITDEYWNAPSQILAQDSWGFYISISPSENNQDQFETVAWDIASWRNLTYQLTYRSDNAAESLQHIGIWAKQKDIGQWANMAITSQAPELGTSVAATNVPTKTPLPTETKTPLPTQTKTPLPTQTNTPIPAETSNAVALAQDELSTPTPAVALANQSGAVDPTDGSGSPGWLLYAALGAVSLLGVGLFFGYRQRSSMPTTATPVAQYESQKTLLGGSLGIERPPLAVLRILIAKADRVNESYPIYNDLTVLGRDPQYTDLQLYNADDESSVSGRHCTIQYEKSTGRFFINDHSTSGTQVNSRRLNRDMPIELPNGAEITLGLLSNNGAKVRFELADAPPLSSETMIDFDLQQQETPATIFDDFGTVTQLGPSDIDDDFTRGQSPPAQTPPNSSWMQDLE